MRAPMNEKTKEWMKNRKCEIGLSVFVYKSIDKENKYRKEKEKEKRNRRRIERLFFPFLFSSIPANE